MSAYLSWIVAIPFKRGSSQFKRARNFNVAICLFIDTSKQYTLFGTQCCRMKNKFRERVQRRRQKLARESTVPTAHEKRQLRYRTLGNCVSFMQISPSLAFSVIFYTWRVVGRDDIVLNATDFSCSSAVQQSVFGCHVGD